MRYLIPFITFLSLSTSAFALTPKDELIGKKFISADKECSVNIDKGEIWKINCDHLANKYGSAALSGKGINIINCYEDARCEGVIFAGKFSRPLQAFIVKDTSGEISLGLVYGSPADGDVEVLFAN